MLVSFDHCEKSIQIQNNWKTIEVEKKHLLLPNLDLINIELITSISIQTSAMHGDGNFAEIAL